MSMLKLFQMIKDKDEGGDQHIHTEMSSNILHDLGVKNKNKPIVIKNWKPFAVYTECY